jgi:hypothetical protein
VSWRNGCPHTTPRRGGLPVSVVDEIERRFGPMRVTEGRQATVQGRVADQAALRGLLMMLWDVNVEVASLRVGAVGPADGSRDRRPGR